MKLLLLGCGNIGGLLLSKWQELQLLDQIVVVQPSMRAAELFQHDAKITFVSAIDLIPQDFAEDLIVLAVKPQNLHSITAALKLRRSKLVLSFLAAVTTDHLAKIFSNSVIVRIMPNIAIKTGKSINLGYSKQNLSAQEDACITNLLQETGTTTWLSDEKLIDLLTPISSSSLAYFFLLAEYLQDEAVKLGLDLKQAKQIVQKAFVSSTSLVSDDVDFAALRTAVTSKKGITEAALSVLAPELKQVLHAAITRGIQRSKEIANENNY